jgi:hypothetical protein
MSIKTDAVVIKNETVAGANTALRVGTNLEAIADDLVAKQSLIDANTAKDLSTKQDVLLEGAFIDGDKTKLDGIESGATSDQDLSAYLTSATATSTYEPLKGVDDNFVTDAEKIVIGNTSGTNTGDQTIPVTGVDFDAVGTDNSDNNAVNTLYSGLATSKQDTLVSGTNIKTINGESLLGATDIVITGGGGLATTDIDTLAELNAIITDATLIDTADARLSDARTPTAHTHTASEVTDFDTEVSNNTSVAANTSKISFDSTSSTRLANTSGTNTGDQAPITSTSTIIDLSNVIGNYDYMTTASTATTFTLTGAVTGGKALVLWDSTGSTVFPTVTGSTLTNSVAWEVNVEFYLNVENNGFQTEHYFTKKDVGIYQVDLTSEVTGTLPVANGGTGLTSLSTLLNSNVTPTTLGLVIGTDVQAHSTVLDNTTASFTTAQETKLSNTSNTNTGDQVASSGTGTVISLTNALGYYGDMTTANTSTTYTTTGTTLGAFAVIRINAATQPAITGATLLTGATFAASTDMHMVVQYFGVTVQYYFIALV